MNGPIDYQPVMVTSPDDRGVIVIGGWKISSDTDVYQNSVTNSLFELRDTSSEWTTLNQTLQHGRTFFVAFYVPTELTDCKMEYWIEV